MNDLLAFVAKNPALLDSASPAELVGGGIGLLVLAAVLGVLSRLVKGSAAEGVLGIATLIVGIAAVYAIYKGLFG